MTDGLKEAYKDAQKYAQKYAQDKIMITCFKCHGAGTYQVPYSVDDTTVGWEKRDCELCDGLGEISLAFYENLQWECRG